MHLHPYVILKILKSFSVFNRYLNFSDLCLVFGCRISRKKQKNKSGLGFLSFLMENLTEKNLIILSLNCQSVSKEVVAKYKLLCLCQTWPNVRPPTLWLHFFNTFGLANKGIGHQPFPNKMKYR